MSKILKYQNWFLMSLLAAVVVVFTLNSCENKDETVDKFECKSFVPNRGTNNTPVIFYGSGFGDDPEAIEVRFNNELAEVIKCDGNEMIVLTPLDPGFSVAITVKKGKETAQLSEKFTYIVGTHQCESIEPKEGFTGTVVTLTGNYFGTNPEAVVVKFNDKVAKILECTDKAIKVETPEYPGDVCNITVTLKGITVQFKAKFTYHPFTLTTFTPAEAGAGAEVTLKGDNFSGSSGDFEVKFNDKTATVVSHTDTEIKVLVPEFLSTNCVISVKKGASSVKSYSATFTYIAVFDLTTFEPLEGGTGTTITLLGDKFGTNAADVQVRFGDKPATVVSCTNTAIKVRTPDNPGATPVISVKIGITEHAYTTNFTYFSDLRLTSFTPLIGGVSKQITLKGYNFGTNVAGIGVMFDNTAATVVNCFNDSAWVRLPATNPFVVGDQYPITVTKGSETKTYTDLFTYTVSMMVTTVAGIGTGAFQEGTLTTARFEPKHLVCDNEGNIIAVIQNPNAVILIDFKNNVVRKIIDLGEECHVPCIDPSGRNVYIPANNGADYSNNIPSSESTTDYYYKVSFDHAKGWNGVSNAAGRINLIRPTAAEKAAGVANFRLRSYHHGYAFSPTDGKVYYKSNQDGGIVRFDPATNKGEWARTMLPNALGKRDTMFMYKNPNQVNCTNSTTVGSITYNPRGDGRLAFNPKEAYMLYGSINQTHVIAYLNILTGEEGIYAGVLKNNTGGAIITGFENGYRTSAGFNGLQQITFDNDGNMIVAEQAGNRIRKIDRVTGIVSTLIGTNTAHAGASGYVDGTPDVARVTGPRGVAVDKNGTIYVADTGNGRIRKISYQ